MEPQPIWSSLEIAKLLVSLLTPLVVVGVGYLFNLRLKKMEQENQERNKLEERRIQEMRDQLERRHEPHIEFTIDCNFFGPQQGKLIAEFIISANNKSLVRHQFKNIFLRVRGIKKDAPLELLEKYPNRLQFDELIFKEPDIKPGNWDFIFVEPGVIQQISFITRIDEDYRFLLAHAEFYYDRFTPHSIERMFEVRT